MAVFTKGLKAGLEQSNSGKSQYVYLKGDGDSFTIVPLVDISEITVYTEHNIWRGAGGSRYFPCIAGEDKCPGCEMGIKTRWRAVMPVLIVNSQNYDPNEVKFYSFGKKLARTFEDLAGMLGEGNFKGSQILVKRTGKGLNTQRLAIPTASRTDVPKDMVIPDPIDTMPSTREAILELISDVVPESENSGPESIASLGAKTF